MTCLCCLAPVYCDMHFTRFRFDIFGIYVVMFLEILKTLVKVLLIFSILIIAFGLSFYILLSQGVSQTCFCLVR